MQIFNSKLNSKLSCNLFEKAKNLIPGGVNSPVRAFKNVGGNPVFFKSGNGPYIIDEDNNQYIDYVGSWGPLILGHNHPKVRKKIEEVLQNGTSFGAPHKLEIELAELITTLMPNIKKIRMVNSGTEATMSAIRLARGYTGKNKIIKFDNCYHGHSDHLLTKAGSGLLTFDLPGSAGVPSNIIQDTITVPYNNLEKIQNIFNQDNFKNDIAAIIIEPIAGNMNMILPKKDFLKNLRKICDQNNTLLIFDEVITGFRVSLSGAQGVYNIKPDLTCLGKIIGGGLPVGAFGGKQEIMEFLAPMGPVYQAGTLSGNPIAMAAGIATLQELKNSDYKKLDYLSNYFVTNIKKLANSYNINISVNSMGGLFGIKFNNTDNNHAEFKHFFHNMLQKGNYFAPSPFESGFISFAHTKEILDKSIEGFGERWDI